MLQLTLLKNLDSFVSYDFFSVWTLKNHISQTTRNFWAKSVGEPFKNHDLALVKFQPGKSSKKKGLSWFGTFVVATAYRGGLKRAKPCQPLFFLNFYWAETSPMLNHDF